MSPGWTADASVASTASGLLCNIKSNEKQDGSYWALFSYYPNPIQIDFLAVAGRQFFFQQLARPNQPGRGAPLWM